jgi:hypothetical protein
MPRYAEIAVLDATEVDRPLALDSTAPRANDWAALLDRRAPDGDNPPSDSTTR